MNTNKGLSQSARYEAHRLMAQQLGPLMIQCKCCLQSTLPSQEIRHLPSCAFHAVATALEAKQVEIERLCSVEQMLAHTLNELAKEKDDWLHERDTLAQQLVSLRYDYAGLEAHHNATDEIIADACSQSPENGRALLRNMDRLKQQLEQAVRLADDLMAQLPHCRRCAEDFREQEIRGCPYCDAKLAMSDLLSSPAIAPIVAKVKGQI